MNLNQKAVIATLNVGLWRTRKHHAAETRQENARHGLTDEARVDIIICAHADLDAVESLHAEARAEHYRLTLPSADNGYRLLPAARQFEHSAAMQSFAARIEAHKAKFLADYERLAADAPARLKGLYVASHWPTHDVVASKFRFATRYLPVPSDGEWNEWLAEAAAEAQDALRDRLADAVRKLAAKLADPKAIFRDSLVANLSDILDLAPDLNLRDDPSISRLIGQAKSLTEFDADTLREDPIARANVADKARDICSLFNL